VLKSSSFPSIDYSVIENISNLNNHKHELFVQRDDLIHAVISGNKWRKLKGVFNKIKEERLLGIETFGGAFSNHLLAAACAANIHGVQCNLYVRGEELTPESNDVLLFCQSMGACIEFLERSEYKKAKSSYGITDRGFFSVPEGGACKEGLLGVMEMGKNLEPYDVVALAQGTTTTSLGLLLSTSEKTNIWVFPALNGFSSLGEMELLAKNCGFLYQFKQQRARIRVMDGYTFGGYAKGTQELLNELKKEPYTIPFPLDSVYTGKAFLGFMREAQKINQVQRMLFIHTGGYSLKQLSLG